jgi:predicted nuclease of predicted toxin-antitoxin system
MGQYLIDNNVISNYFSGLFPEKAMDFISPDAIIAATAIGNLFSLITSDTDFRNHGLIVIDPYKL